MQFVLRVVIHVLKIVQVETTRDHGVVRFSDHSRLAFPEKVSVLDQNQSDLPKKWPGDEHFARKSDLFSERRGLFLVSNILELFLRTLNI